MVHCQKDRTKNGIGLTRQQVIDWAISKGWKLDRFGHLQREFDNKIYRLVVSRIAVRHEVQVRFDPGYGRPKNHWVRLQSGYLIHLFFTPANTLGGLKR